MDGARLGLALGQASLHVVAERELPVATAPWALALELPGAAGGLDWLDGRVEREVVNGAAGRTQWCTGDVVDADEQADAGMLALAADRILGGLAAELALPTDARLAYAVPDAVDELSQRSLRRAFGASFHRAVPVWRSVAAAMAWTAAAGERGPRAGESVVIVDTELPGVSLTVLTARHDEQLARTHPASRGIYWERKPPLPPDAQLETLGWPHVLRAYARRLVARELGEHAPELHARIVEDLLRSGMIASLVARGGAMFVQVPSSQRAEPDVVEFFEDATWFDDEVARWSARLDGMLDETLATLGKVRRLLIGGPCAYPRFRTTKSTGRIKLFDEDRRFGFIAPEDGGADLFFHGSAVDAVEGFVPSRDLAVQFEVGRGRKGPEAYRVTPIGPLAGWLRRRATVSPRALADGARECLLRQDTGSLTWREWLPELSLEVVRDGHFGELPLLERGTFVDPFLGDAVTFTVSEVLTLARGHRWFSFPLLVGRQGRRPVAWEARLESPAFPLDHDIRARLELSYRYGLDSSYQLAVEPASADDAPFGRVEATWIKGGDDSASSRRAPLTLEPAPWDVAETTRFLDAARSLDRLRDERYAKFLFAVTRACWSRARCLATAPPAVQRIFPTFCAQLLDALPPEIRVEEVPRALEVLALLHEDAPLDVVGWLLDLEDAAGDDPTAYKGVAGMLAMLVGDGTGERAALLDRLLARLMRHAEGDTFDARLAGLTLRALGNAAWRHPGFIGALVAVPDGAALVLRQCRRSLQGLLARIPVDLDSDDELETLIRRYGTPFRDVCELLLALMAVDPDDPVVAPLRTGSPSADGFAKLVRQLDARFASLGARLRWRVQLDVEVPAALHRMSPVAFALNAYLAEGAGANLVHVAGAEFD